MGPVVTRAFGSSHSFALVPAAPPQAPPPVLIAPPVQLPPNYVDPNQNKAPGYDNYGYGGGGGGGSGGGIGPPPSQGFVQDQFATAPPEPAAAAPSIFTVKNVAIAAGLFAGGLVLKKVLHV